MGDRGVACMEIGKDGDTGIECVTRWTAETMMDGQRAKEVVGNAEEALNEREERIQWIATTSGVSGISPMSPRPPT